MGRPEGEAEQAPSRRDLDDPNAIDRLDLDEPDEDRELITGLIGDVLFTVCYVERGYLKRIISARKATNREQIDYNEANAPSPDGVR